MNTDIQVFTNEQFGSIRTAGTTDEPLFCANDVCTALGFGNPRQALASHVDTPDVQKLDIGVVTGKKADGTDAVQIVSTAFVTESGLYALIFGSKLESAKSFKRWVTSEVLPAIRKTGKYSIPVIPTAPSDKELDIRAKEANLAIAEFYHKLSAKYEAKSEEYSQVLDAYATKTLEGEFVLPLPEATKRTYSAGEIGERLGISANRVGRIANLLKLKTSQYGKYFIDKSKSGTKEVETFRYYDNVLPRISEAVAEEVT